MIEEYKNNIEEFWKELFFVESTHTYTVGKKKLPSVSGLIKKYYKSFNAKRVSENKAKREGKCAKTLRAEWKKAGDDACDFGHKVHTFGEFYPYDNSLKPSSTHEEAIVKFWGDLPKHIIPVTMELRMYHKVFKFSGTADILLYDTINKCFIIADYKTNKDLFKNFAGQKMTKIFSHFLDTPFNHYQLQLSYYQILFEQIGYKVSRRIIIWLKEDGTYEMYDTEDLTSILIKELKNK